MTTIGSPVYGGNSNNPLWLSANPTSISLAGTAPLVLTNIGGVLAQNGTTSAPTANWSLYAATSNTIKMDNLGNNITNSGSNLYFNGNLIANASDVSNIADWALYNASADVNLSNAGSNYSIVNAKNITAISNVGAATLTASGNITAGGILTGATATIYGTTSTPTVSNTNLSLNATSALTTNAGTTTTVNTTTNETHTINRGSDFSDVAKFKVNTLGGKGGDIELLAEGVTYSAGSTTVANGGVITLTATSPIALPYTLTSAIKLSAASIVSYAGAISPYGSLAGYNFIQGLGGVNIVAGGVPTLPNTLGTVYIYGANGTSVANGLYTDTLANRSGSDLRIQADTGRSGGGSNNLYLSNVKSIIMEGSNGEVGSLMSIDGSYINSSSNKGNSFIKNFYGMDNIGYINATGACAFGSVNATLVKGLTLQGSSLQPYVGYFPGGRCDLTLLAPATPGEAVVNNDIVLNASSNIRLITSNSGQVQVTGSISTSNITSSADLTLTATSNLNLNGTVLVNGSAIGTASNWSTYPATSIVNLSNQTISNAGVIAATGTLTLTSLNPSSGNIILTAGSNYSQINLQAGSALSISSSNSILLAGSNVTISSPLNLIGYAISNVPSINNVGPININSTSNVFFNQQLDLTTKGIRNTGALTGVTTINGATIPLNPATSNLDMGGNSISNVSSILSTSAPLNISNSAGNILLTSSVGGITEYAATGMSLGAGNIPAAPTHQILMSAGGGAPMYISSSNSIQMTSPTTRIVNEFVRYIGGVSPIVQPVTQYGSVTAIGSSNTALVSLPSPYTTSYNVFITHTSTGVPSPPYPTFSVFKTNLSSFTIGYTGGTGSNVFDWMAVGT